MTERLMRILIWIEGLPREPLKCPLVVKNLAQRWRERQTRELSLVEQYRRVWRENS